MTRRWLPFVGGLLVCAGVVTLLYCVYSVFEQLLDLRISKHQLVGILGVGAILSVFAYIVGMICQMIATAPIEGQIYEMGPIRLAMLDGLVREQYNKHKHAHQPDIKTLNTEMMQGSAEARSEWAQRQENA
jgi:hypothetical protein|tara:strand:- start:271 stop:663 length:393 start_codon:yes stop_codon:yes gene_type:complete